MVCKKCGKVLPVGKYICSDCNSGSLNTLNSFNNNITKDGKMSEYITEKYNNKKGVYAEKRESDNKKVVFALLFIIIVLVVIVFLTILNYLV